MATIILFTVNRTKIETVNVFFFSFFKAAFLLIRSFLQLNASIFLDDRQIERGSKKKKIKRRLQQHQSTHC